MRGAFVQQSTIYDFLAVTKSSVGLSIRPHLHVSGCEMSLY